jgi:hypothetical protein
MPTSFPGAIEVCDGQDNDCNGDVDETGCIAGPCELISQFGCPAGESCYLDVGPLVTMCLPPGPLQLGEPCGGINECADGALCLDLFGGGSVCNQWCDINHPSPCLQPGFQCAPAGAQDNLGICIP